MQSSPMELVSVLSSLRKSRGTGVVALRFCRRFWSSYQPLFTKFWAYPPAEVHAVLKALKQWWHFL